MSNEQQILAAIRAEIANMPDASRIRVQAIAQTLRNAIIAGGGEAQIALGLVGAELAAQGEEPK